MPTYFAESLAQLKLFEACIPWMYLDSVGKVTVGVGLMLPNAAAASALAFTLAGAPATPAQIAADFARVAALAPDKLPAFYRAATSPELPQSIIDAKLSAVLTTFETDLRAAVPAYDALPDAVKIALLDMAYNLGPTGLLKGYPHMLAAIAVGNWAQAAAQCARNGIGDARNAWTKQQFLSAGIANISAEAEAGSLIHRLMAWLKTIWRRLRPL
jgi:GH24 family phage-related lysozyme (muramidase)